MRTLPRYLVRHHAGLKYVRAIPHDLQPLEGKKAWTECVGKDIDEAANRALELAAEHNRRAAALRALPEADKQSIISKGGLARCQEEAALADYIASILHPYTIKHRTEKARQQTTTAIVSMLSRHTTTHNIVAKLDGAPIHCPRLFDLIALHEKHKPSLKAKTRERERTYVRRFVDVVGDLEPREVTRQHVRAFVEHLQAKGYTSDNIDQHLAKLNILFKTGMAYDAVDANPVYGIKAPKVEKAELDNSFTADQVRLIFREADKRTADFEWVSLPDFRWIIRLLAYHGARSGEVCQLKCADITKLHGVDVIRVHGRNGSVKNKFSVRDVPIHPKCRGIIAYTRKVAKEHGADSWLFASLKDSKAGRAHPLQNRGNDWLREIGFTEKRPNSRQHVHSWHTFRHTFSTLCREVEMSDAVKYALMGHALGFGEGGKYGTGPSLKLRAKWIAKIDPLKM